jgi:acetyl-CoA C-acetyltransferase
LVRAWSAQLLCRSAPGRHAANCNPRVGIIGIGQSAFKARRDDASYPDLVREAVNLALHDGGLELDDIEAVVYSLSPDAMVGIGNAERTGVDAVGARGKRFLRINTGGATGISSVAAAYYHVASGACDVVMTAGADKVGECGDSQTVLNKIWDPTYERQLPLGTINMLAMSGVRYAHKYGMSEHDMAAVVVKNRSHAAKNSNAHLRKETSIDEVMASRYISWPIKLFDCCPQSSGGGAMVLASEKYIKDRKLDAVWITGVGHCTETYYLGDRMGRGFTADHADAHALKGAFERSYKMAGINNPQKQINVAELYAPFSNTEFHSIEAAGLAPLGKSPADVLAGRFSIGGEIPVNPSGGTLCTNAIAVTAMIRVAEIALQVRGTAGGHQVKGARVGVASGNGGDHQFFGTMVVES